MSQSLRLTYLFDPLCGWCYGAAPAMAALAGATDVTLDLLPTGLFSRTGARPMDDGFAAYAWANDQRIARLTGQEFSDLYRRDVLANRTQMFDSGPATLALTAARESGVANELAALKAIQLARYVDGRDITSLGVLADTLATLGLEDAARRVAAPDAALIAMTQSRAATGSAMLRSVFANGVPTLALDNPDGSRSLVPSAALYANPETLVSRLKAA
ncbi:DsbA family protein [Pannonibacter carbonis]|uniref:DsbA family protein n=1 Tax=Pannonibacter carbonis TaxID=2067569 RepID=UPI000D10A607|nr:protein-disulfide isomerase [Pannonibacter carbonis]